MFLLLHCNLKACELLALLQRNFLDLGLDRNCNYQDSTPTSRSLLTISLNLNSLYSNSYYSTPFNHFIIIIFLCLCFGFERLSCRRIVGDRSWWLCLMIVVVIVVVVIVFAVVVFVEGLFVVGGRVVVGWVVVVAGGWGLLIICRRLFVFWRNGFWLYCRIWWNCLGFRRFVGYFGFIRCYEIFLQRKMFFFFFVCWKKCL